MLSEKLKSVLDDRLWEAAERVINHYCGKGYKVSEFISIDDTYPYKPHIVCKKGFETLAIDIREKCNIEPIQRFLIGCLAKRVAVKIYYAVPEKIDGNETTHTHAQKNSMKEFGLGLLVVRENDIVIDFDTISCNRRFALEPGTSLGVHKRKIDELIGKYNLGNCLDAVRDLSEEAEDATFALAKKAAKKAKINLSVADIVENKVSWDQVINVLDAPIYKGVAQTKILSDPKFKNSLTNVRDKRNLSDHKKSAKERRQMEEQYPEAMQQGIRVIRELVKLTNGLK